MIVIDASVATKLINTQEEDSAIVKELLIAHIEKREEIIVPHLLFLEVANALATKSLIKELYIKKGMHLLYEADFLLYEETENDILEATLLAKKYSTSVYDMLYAVVAKKKNVRLITSDRKFTSKVALHFIENLHTLNEQK